ncbi:hypothetical protein AM587_10004280 [Phytophthora nicotianae]|uniref:Uncharacterized protein n=1 Tax=Phytophthora nicotianae TaxID=4792 RepID=A0A0W8E124_PHYNI|nr:hypothetical protein AM587_10004280 [Phytophthora nicotianae]
MRLHCLILTIGLAIAVTSNGIGATTNDITEATTVKSNLIHDALSSLHVPTRELSDDDTALEERRGFGATGHGHAIGGGGHVVSGGEGGYAVGTGGGDTATGGGHMYGDTATGGGHMYMYGAYTSGARTNNGSMNSDKVEKKCNKFVNWWKRLFNKNVEKCQETDDEDEDIRRLRA